MKNIDVGSSRRKASRRRMNTDSDFFKFTTVYSKKDIKTSRKVLNNICCFKIHFDQKDWKNASKDMIKVLEGLQDLKYINGPADAFQDDDSLTKILEEAINIMTSIGFAKEEDRPQAIVDLVNEKYFEIDSSTRTLCRLNTPELPVDSSPVLPRTPNSELDD